jgi:hypothetical protein
MLDIIAGFIFGAMFATNVFVLVGLARIRPGIKFTAVAVAAVWAVAIVTIAAMGGFAPGSIGPLPAPVLAFSILVIAGLVAWFFSPAFFNALLSLPVAALVGINSFRIGGVFFLLLFAQGRLSSPFAPSAGWGDIITGVAAIPLAAMAAFGKPVSNRVLAIWNAFGALDLIVAIAFAFLSAPGTPFRIFTAPPGTEVLTNVPWIAAATMLVPLYLFTHLIIAARLRLAKTGTSEQLGNSTGQDNFGSRPLSVAGTNRLQNIVGKEKS